jgi:hypothetical protein
MIEYGNDDIWSVGIMGITAFYLLQTAFSAYFYKTFHRSSIPTFRQVHYDLTQKNWFSKRK